MAKKIVIDIEVNGKMQKATVSAKKLKDALDGTATSARTADRNMKGASQQSANSTKNFSKMAQGMTGTLVPAYATLAANVFAVTALFSALKQAADFRVIQNSQVAFSSATGVGLKTLTSTIKSATDGLIGFEAASQAAAIGTASGLNTTQIEQLAEGAKNVSLILGRDVTDSFNRLIRGVTKAEPELLDELGITLRLADATERYAASLNKSAKELTLYEKSQSVAVEVQRQLDEKYASTAQAVELQSNSIAKLGTEFEKVLNPIKSFVSFITEPAAEFLAENIRALTAAFALLAIPIVKALIPGLEDWAETSQASAQAAANSIKAAKNEIEALKQAQVELAQTGADPGKSAQQAVMGIKTKKGTGIDLLQKGEVDKLTKRQVTALRVAAEKGTGAVKKMSDDMRRQYIAALREMEGKTNSTGAKIRTEFARTQKSVGLSIKKIGAQWELTMSRMKKFGAQASKFLNGVFRFAGIFGVLFLLKDLMVGALQYFGIGEQPQEVLDLANSIDAVTESLKTVQKEFSKFAEVQTKFYEKQGNELPMLDQLAAVGNFIEGNVKALNDAFDVMDKFKQFITPATEAVEQLSLARDKLNDMEEAKIQGSSSAVRKQRREVRNLQGAVDANANEVNVGPLGELFLNQVDPSAKLIEMQKEVKSTAIAMAAGLKAARIETQVGGTEFLKLVEILAEGKELTREQREEFNTLADSLIGIGKEAKLAQQSFSSLTMQFDKKVSSTTQFKTSVTDIINEMEALKTSFETTLSNEEGAGKRVQELTKMLTFLNKIRKQEIEYALEISRLEAKRERDKRGRIGGSSVAVPKLMAAEIQKQNAIARADIEVRKAQAALDVATSEGVVTDPARLEILINNLEKATIVAQNLKEEFSGMGRVLDSVASSFEAGFADAFASIITGTSSVKEAFLSMSKMIIQALAQLIAQMVAVRIMQMIIGMNFGGATKVDSTSFDMMGGGMGSQMGSGAMGYGGMRTARYGGMFDAKGNSMPGYAVGGIAKGSQAGYPAILHGTEAVVPLPNGKSIPVDMKGSGQQNNVTVNVSVDQQGNATQDTQADNNSAQRLGTMIASAVQKELHNQKRAGGILNPMGVS